jgi:hypothetical protein
MKRRWLTSLKPDKVVSGLSLVVSVIALLLSYQSNQIAKEQGIAHVIFEGSRYIFTPPDSSGETLTCTYKIRLSNIGQLSTTLVNYDAIILYRNTASVSRGTGETWVFDGAFDFTNLPLTFPPQFEMLDEEALRGQEPTLSLPVQIESGDTVDVILRTKLKFDESIRFFIIPSSSYTRFWNQDFTGFYEEGTPLRVRLSLYMSSGQILETPELICTFLK